MNRFRFLLLFLFFWINLSAQTHFIITSYPDYTPADAKIFMAGNFNSWNPGDTSFILHPNSDGNPEIVLSYSPGTQIEYKFTLGSWQTVEKGPNGEEISNRQYTFPSTEDTVLITIYNWAGVDNQQVPHTTAENVFVLTDSFYIPQLGRYRRIWIYLPPDYDSSSRRYPVIYMHDGQNLFDDYTSFAGEWHVDEHLNHLYSLGYSVPIVVGIDNGGAYRIDELTPYPNPQYGGGQGDAYVRFIVNTLKPYIDSAFRTDPDRDHTWIWGSSLGGLISFYAGVKYNDVFSRIGAFSPSFWINDPQIFTLAQNTSLQKPTFFYFLAGGQEGADMTANCRKMMSLLQANGLDSVYMHLRVNPYGRHNEAFWSSEFERAYLWLAITGPEQADTSASLNYRLYPNPVQNKLMIDTQKYTVRYDCSLFTVGGRAVFTRTCTGKTGLDLSALPPGVYILRITYKSKVYTNRVIKI